MAAGRASESSELSEDISMTDVLITFAYMKERLTMLGFLPKCVSEISVATGIVRNPTFAMDYTSDLSSWVSSCLAGHGYHSTRTCCPPC